MSTDTKELPAVALLLSDNRGTYIPRDFVTGFDLAAWGLDADNGDVMACENHDSEWYWEAWDNVMREATYIPKNQLDKNDYWTLYQDGDLWALNTYRMTDEEKHDFGFAYEWCLTGEHYASACTCEGIPDHEERQD